MKVRRERRPKRDRRVWEARRRRTSVANRRIRIFSMNPLNMMRKP
jgi:hypothetical protein